LTAYCTQHAIVLGARYISPGELGAVLPASAVVRVKSYNALSLDGFVLF